MIKIEDITIPAKGDGKYLNVRVLPFDLDPTEGIQLYWAIHAETTSTDNEGVETLIPGAVLLDGNLHMPQSTYDTWGTDDSVVKEFALQKLYLKELNITE